MTLKQTFSFMIASISLIAATTLVSTAQALPPPGPPNPGPNPGSEQRSVILRQRFINQTISVRRLLGIDNRFNGYSIDSVVVDVHGINVGTQMHMTINGQIRESLLNPLNRVYFIPRFKAVFGAGVQDLGLYIQGLADIDAITLNMTRPSDNQPEQVTVPMNIFKRMYGNDRVELSQYADLTQYNGMRLVALEITGRANAETAAVDVVIDNRNSTNSVELNSVLQTYTVYPRNVVIGRDAAFIALLNRGDLNIDTVTLKLAR